MKQLDDITSVEQFIHLIDHLEIHKVHHSHKRLWCRGQVQKDWAIQPGIYRGDFHPINEKDRFEFEYHLNQEFISLSGPNIKGSETEEELYFLQQHYGMRTRLVDWTNNPLIALWFSVEKDFDHDGCFFFMDVYQMENLGDRFGIATPKHKAFTESIKYINSFGNVGEFPDTIFPIRPAHKIERIRHQGSFFTFHVPAEPILNEKHNKTLTKAIIPGKIKPTIKATLKKIGIDSYFIYGGLEKMAGELEASYITRWKKNI
jgi:hypothetical protein